MERASSRVARQRAHRRLRRPMDYARLDRLPYAPRLRGRSGARISSKVAHDTFSPNTCRRHWSIIVQTLSSVFCRSDLAAFAPAVAASTSLACQALDRNRRLGERSGQGTGRAPPFVSRLVARDREHATKILCSRGVTVAAPRESRAQFADLSAGHARDPPARTNGGARPATEGQS